MVAGERVTAATWPWWNVAFRIVEDILPIFSACHPDQPGHFRELERALDARRRWLRGRLSSRMLAQFAAGCNIGGFTTASRPNRYCAAWLAARAVAILATPDGRPAAVVAAEVARVAVDARVELARAETQEAVYAEFRAAQQKDYATAYAALVDHGARRVHAAGVEERASARAAHMRMLRDCGLQEWA